MIRLTIIIACILAQALSRPQEPVAVAAKSEPIAIISQNEEINPDGSFSYSYETANGIKVDQSGFLKEATDPNSTDRIQVIEGSVSYTDNDGQVISLRYVADENGFQPEGDHLPTAPSSPSAPGQARSAPSSVKETSTAVIAAQSAAATLLATSTAAQSDTQITVTDTPST